jgi:hypothetical protein
VDARCPKTVLKLVLSMIKQQRQVVAEAVVASLPAIVAHISALSRKRWMGKDTVRLVFLCISMHPSSHTHTHTMDGKEDD